MGKSGFVKARSWKDGPERLLRPPRIGDLQTKAFFMIKILFSRGRDNTVANVRI